MTRLDEVTRPIASGAALAVLAALAFGFTTPIVERAGHELGPFSTAALLYAGAALSAVRPGGLGASNGVRPGRRHVVLLLAVAFFGAGLAPTLLAWGLQRTGGALGSLLLNLEAVFTVLLAWLIHREHVGGRVLLALLAMVSGGVLMTVDAAGLSLGRSLGGLAVLGATLAWAVDNTLTRGLAALDPVRVVGAKGALGAGLTGVSAVAMGEPLPGPGAATVLLLCGATGYGLSLRLYLLAQRKIGAARTGSVFALAPFVGAVLAWALGDRLPGSGALVASALFGLGVYLHLTERHGHLHPHPALSHEHAHRHDDGHHDHSHDPPVVGEHTHPHAHLGLEHTHEHGLDVHHDHPH